MASGMQQGLREGTRDPSIAGARNGFVLWKSLLRIYQPSTRSRSLALIQAIHGYPNFVSGVSSVAQISKLEELVKDYERCSGQTYPREILLSTLLRCIPSPLKEHIHLQLTDRTTYAQVKESVLVYERTARRKQEWTTLRNRRKSINVRRTTSDGSRSSTGERKRLER